MTSKPGLLIRRVSQNNKSVCRVSNPLLESTVKNSPQLNITQSGYVTFFFFFTFLPGVCVSCVQLSGILIKMQHWMQWLACRHTCKCPPLLCSLLLRTLIECHQSDPHGWLFATISGFWRTLNSSVWHILTLRHSRTNTKLDSTQIILCIHLCMKISCILLSLAELHLHIIFSHLINRQGAGAKDRRGNQSQCRLS